MGTMAKLSTDGASAISEDSLPDTDSGPLHSSTLFVGCWVVFGLRHFFYFFFGLQDSCLFLSSKKAFRTPDEPEIRRNNGPVCMQ